MAGTLMIAFQGAIIVMLCAPLGACSSGLGIAAVVGFVGTVIGNLISDTMEDISDTMEDKWHPGEVCKERKRIND